MLTLSDPFSFSSPSIADVNGDLSAAHLGLPDDANIELELAEQKRAELECWGCRQDTEGTMILGVRCSVCPNCLEKFVNAQMPDRRKFMTMYIQAD